MARFVAQQFLESLSVSLSQCLHHSSRNFIRRRRWRFPGKRIGPFRALINPFLDDADFLRVQGAGGRHLNPVLAANQPQIKAAAGAVSRTNHGNCAAAHRVAAAVKAEPVFLLSGPVASHAARLQNRLDVAPKFNFLRLLRTGHPPENASRTNCHRNYLSQIFLLSPSHKQRWEFHSFPGFAAKHRALIRRCQAKRGFSFATLLAARSPRTRFLDAA